VRIDWGGPNGSIVNDSRIIVRPTISNDGIIHNSSMQFLYVSQNDTGVFTCNVAILHNNASQVFQLKNLTSKLYGYCACYWHYLCIKDTCVGIFMIRMSVL